MPKSRRLPISLDASLFEALEKESAKTGKSISELVRLYIVTGLQSSGHTVNSSVHWGGKRAKP